MSKYKICYEIPGCPYFSFCETVETWGELTEEDADRWCRARGAQYIDFQEVA